MKAKELLKKKSVRLKIVLLLLVGALASGACIRMYVRDFANRTFVRYHDDDFSIKVIRKNMNYYAIRTCGNSVDTVSVGNDYSRPYLRSENNNFVLIDFPSYSLCDNACVVVPKEWQKKPYVSNDYLLINDSLKVILEEGPGSKWDDVNTVKIYHYESNQFELIPLKYSYSKLSIHKDFKISIRRNELQLIKDNITQTFPLNEKLFLLENDIK